MLYCPNQPFQCKKCKNAVLSQKKPIKPKFGDLGLLQGLEVSKFVFFGFFWTVQHFCRFWPNKHCFFWDSTAFLHSQAPKVLYCPKKTNLFKAKSAKMLYCPKKTKKTKVWRPWAPPGPGGLQTLVFVGQYSIFAVFRLKTLVFSGQYSVFALPCLESVVLSQKNQSF